MVENMFAPLRSRLKVANGTWLEMKSHESRKLRTLPLPL